MRVWIVWVNSVCVWMMVSGYSGDVCRCTDCGVLPLVWFMVCNGWCGYYHVVSAGVEW